MSNILVEQPATLYFEILTVGIGQQFLPDISLIGQCPAKKLFPHLFIAISNMHHPEIFTGPVCSEIWFIGAGYMIRFAAAEIVLSPSRQVLTAFFIHWPRDSFTSVTNRISPGIDQFQIFSRFNSCINPVVIGLTSRITVVPKGGSGKPSLIFRQINLHGPTGTSDQIEITDPTTHTTIWILRGEVIDWK